MSEIIISKISATFELNWEKEKDMRLLIITKRFTIELSEYYAKGIKGS